MLGNEEEEPGDATGRMAGCSLTGERRAPAREAPGLRPAPVPATSRTEPGPAPRRSAALSVSFFLSVGESSPPLCVVIIDVFIGVGSRPHSQTSPQASLLCSGRGFERRKGMPKSSKEVIVEALGTVSYFTFLKCICFLSDFLIPRCPLTHYTYFIPPPALEAKEAKNVWEECGLCRQRGDCFEDFS